MLLRKLILSFTEIYIPKSRNNGNDSDYIYLDILNGDDVGKYVLFEKKFTTKSPKSELPELLEKNQTTGNAILI